MLKNVFGLLFKNPMLIIYPIILDAISFIGGLHLAGFIGTPSLSYRLIMEMGLPSVSYVSNIPQLINQLQFMGEKLPASAWIPVIAMLLLTTVAQGGYIASLRNVVEGKSISVRQFISDGLARWVPFILLFMIITAAKTAVSTFLVAFLGVSGLLLALIIIMVLRIVFIYVEFSIVIDFLSIGAAFQQSRRYFRANSFQTLGLIAVLLLASGMCSILLHLLWSPLAVSIAIPVCALILGAIQLGFMQLFIQIRQQL